MLVGVVVYHFGRQYLPVDQITRQRTQQIPVGNEKLTAEDRQGILALVLLCALNVMFWAVYEQQGNTMQLWSEQRTDWNFFGINWPSTWYQSFNPVMILIFTPLLTKLWLWQAKRNKEPNSITKMGMGSIFAGFGFVFMIVASKVLGPHEQGSLLWLTAATAFITIGEIYLSPIGLSFVTKVAPARMVSMLMGLWLMSSFFGNYASGWIGGFYEVLTKDQFFILLTTIGITTGLVFLLCSGVFKKRLHKHL